MSLNCSYLCDSHVKYVAHNCLRRCLFLPVQTVVRYPSCFTLWLALYLGGVFLLQTEGTQDSILPGARAGETSPSPGGFSAGEVCCVLSAQECLCSVCQGTLVQTSVTVTQPRNLLSSSSSWVTFPSSPFGCK